MNQIQKDLQQKSITRTHIDLYMKKIQRATNIMILRTFRKDLLQWFLKVQNLLK